MKTYKVSNTLPDDDKYSGNWHEDLEYIENEKDFFDVLKHYNIDYIRHDFPLANDHIFFVEGYDEVIEYDGGSYVTIKNAQEWVDDIPEWVLHQYIETPEEAEDPWESLEVCEAYHGTTEENAKRILKVGLEPRNETRGLTNRSTGSAIFLSQEYDQADYYYEVVLKVNLCAMAEDGYKPRLEKETPIVEGELRSQLAYRIGFTDYVPDVSTSDGIFDDTLVIYGNIPPKYISLVQ